MSRSHGSYSVRVFKEKVNTLEAYVHHMLLLTQKQLYVNVIYQNRYVVDLAFCGVNVEGLWFDRVIRIFNVTDLESQIVNTIQIVRDIIIQCKSLGGPSPFAFNGQSDLFFEGRPVEELVGEKKGY